MTINVDLHSAIQLFIERGRAFSAADVAAYADSIGYEAQIDAALQSNTSLLKLTLDNGRISTRQAYLATVSVRQWWMNATLRWAHPSLDYVTSSQLASAMSLAFGDIRWSVPDAQVLEIGRRLAMVADGKEPDTYVFPWAVFLCANPSRVNLFRHTLSAVDDRPLFQAELQDGLVRALQTLDGRSASIVRMRFGLDGHSPSTLEAIGQMYDVSRERIRQIEQRALDRLAQPSRLRLIWEAYVSMFIASGGSLLLENNHPERELICSLLKVQSVPIADSDLAIMCLNASDSLSLDAALSLAFLTRADYSRLEVIAEEHFSQSLTRPMMLAVALRNLGRAAHYNEIAETCNHLFPDRMNSIHNWHAALNTPASVSLGIVWIGRKGVYGLVEHGYSRPFEGLYDAVARIVEERYAEVQEPVLFNYIEGKLAEERREVALSSISMALGLNERLQSVGHGRYVPKTSSHDSEEHPGTAVYDIDAAFRAFSTGDGEEQPHR